ncbi:MAG TPA: phosphate ABC transporter substrate-binding protein [Chloroflexi bacterium]|nr:phosphate ABC transporter substrate-binding protein [Chloroflexota bacterium]
MTKVERHRWIARTVVQLFVVGLLLVGCSASVEPPAPIQLRLAGSSSMQILMDELAAAYTSRYDWVTIDLDPRGSQLGLEALREGAVDIALVSRELSADEERGLASTVIAYDAIAIVVNDQNPVDSLTIEQLRGVFSGQILMWSEVGGEEADIQVVSREDGSGTRAAFEAMLMEGQEVTTMAVVVPSNEAVGRFVQGDALSVGYASAVGLPLGTRAVRVSGARPSLQGVSQGEYPLVRPFVLVSRQDGGEEVRSFLDFVLSPAGQVIVGQRYGRVK